MHHAFLVRRIFLPVGWRIARFQVSRFDDGGGCSTSSVSNVATLRRILGRLIKLHKSLFDRNRPIELASAVGIDRAEGWQTSFPSFWICFTVQLREEAVWMLKGMEEIENERLKGQVWKKRGRIQETSSKTKEIREWESSVIKKRNRESLARIREFEEKVDWWNRKEESCGMVELKRTTSGKKKKVLRKVRRLVRWK